VHPLFTKTAELQKRVVRLARSDFPADREEASRISAQELPELLEQASALHDKLQRDGKLLRRSSVSIYGLEDYAEGAKISEEHYLYHWICWFKYNKTVKQLMSEYKSGDIKAVKQFHALNLEFDKCRLGEVDPNRLRFKTDIDHFDLIVAGLDLGIELLTPKELADCFDELCPCGLPHFPDLLSKLRTRIETMFPLVQE
jgi:hypothetical protein